jgi:glycogen synthase
MHMHVQVSPTYAFEVGSHPAIATNAANFMGIRNGIDTELWSPSENKFLPMSYSADNAEEGKRRCAGGSSSCAASVTCVIGLLRATSGKCAPLCPPQAHACLVL